MTNTGPGPNATVEEILASIRQAISEDDARRMTSRGRASFVQSGARGPVAGATNAFAPSDPSDDHDEEDAGVGREASAEPSREQVVIDLAIEQALEGVRAQLEGTNAVQSRMRLRQPESAPFGGSRSIPRSARPTALRREIAAAPTRPALISTRMDQRVSASLDDLAKAMIEGNANRLDEVVEEMLRPMLQSWLDSNLPQMVERLVREEIERVSRGRR